MPYLSEPALGLLPNEIERMTRAAQRYHFASLQDRHPIIGFLHNAYAVAIMDVLRDLATDEEIERETGLKMRSFRSEVHAEQDRLQRLGIELAQALKSRGLAG